MVYGKPIKLLFTDFWGSSAVEEIHKNPIYRMLSSHWDITLSSQPDFLIYSYKGFEYLKYDCVRIFYTGENIRPRFERCDYAFSFDYPITERNYRLPLYRLYNEYDSLFQSWDVDSIISKKRKFCCFLYSNSKAGERIKFFDMLSKNKKVDSGGRVLNNVGFLVKDKIPWFEGYKFNITFENCSHPGYTTEKILHALVANTIPIYWGNPLVAKDFNPKSFINCHAYNSFDEVIDLVKEIDENDNLYREYLSQPRLPHNTENEFCKEENIIAKFDQIFTQRKAFISPSIKKKHSRMYVVFKAISFLPARIRNYLKPFIEVLR